MKEYLGTLDWLWPGTYVIAFLTILLIVFAVLGILLLCGSLWVKFRGLQAKKLKQWRKCKTEPETWE